MTQPKCQQQSWFTLFCVNSVYYLKGSRKAGHPSNRDWGHIFCIQFWQLYRFSIPWSIDAKEVTFFWWKHSRSRMTCFLQEHKVELWYEPTLLEPCSSSNNVCSKGIAEKVLHWIRNFYASKQFTEQKFACWSHSVTFRMSEAYENPSIEFNTAPCIKT